jgi:RNA polymerase sigma factor (sigma-70 family)
MTLHGAGEWQLLQSYAKDRSEAAFAELVRRHVDWVYSVALRHVGDPNLAEDVVESVFVLLAAKAGDLRPGTLLGGWLFRTTRHVAGHARRTEQRRKNREATASTMIHDYQAASADEVIWQQLAPHLDLAVAALSEADRAPILLRFYEKMPLRKIGERLGVSEEAAKKRISRAVEKMRKFLNERGVKPGGAVLAAVLAERTVHAAPPALEDAVIKVSMGAASASASVVLPLLARETTRAWRCAKIKLFATLAVALLVLIFITVNTAGLLGRSAVRQSVTSENFALSTTVRVRPALAPSAGADAASTSSVPEKIGVLTGLVVDEGGRPIIGANVWGGSCSQPFARDTTDQSGRFSLDTVGSPSLVTVSADGFAADQQQFDPADSTKLLVFHLISSPSLTVRVVDESGQGIDGVEAFLSSWWGRAGTLGQYLSQQTDANGSLQWLSAPRGEFQMEFVKAGYRYSRTNKFSADGLEHIVVLHPEVAVTGSVNDAETGTLLAKFKITKGHAPTWFPDDPTPIYWEYDSQIGSNGFYKTAIKEEQRPYLRIEAEGYETVETAIQLASEIEIVKDFQLKPLSRNDFIRGTVLLPDGNPAVNIEVALCTAQVGVMLEGIAFAPSAFGNIPSAQKNDYRRKTDQRGWFVFEPRPGAHTIVAAGPASLGQVRCFDFSKPLEIRLRSWGRIEGSVRTRDGQSKGRKVKWQKTGNLTGWRTLFFDSKGFAARSDAAGNFTLEHVPPGWGRVLIDEGPDIAPIFSLPMQVNPAETTGVQIGGAGRPVRGSLVAPPGIEIRNWSNQVTLARLQVQWAAYPLPKDLTGSGVERWKLEFEDTEAGRAWFRDQCLYDFKVGADGSFTLPEVLPGKYSLFVFVAQGSLGSGADSTPSNPGDAAIASGVMKFEVPDASGESVPLLDLGRISLTATH